MSKFFSVLVLCSVVCFSACHQVKNKAHAAISATGETIGKGSSEFVQGVSEGIDHTLACTVTLSKELEAAGLSYGKYTITSDSIVDNTLHIYLIFNRNFDRTVSIRLYDSKHAEYGRTTATLTGKEGSARYYDIAFDRQTGIESKSIFEIQ